MTRRYWTRPGAGALCLAALLLAGQAAGEDAAATSAETGAETGASADPALAAAMEAGEKLYLKNCRTCHGTRGTAGVPLAKNAKVQFDYGYLVWAVLTGPGYMPEFSEALSDEQIAGIATYVLNSWGNDYGLVTDEDVHGQR